MKIIKEQLSPVGLVSTASDVDSGTDDTKFLTAKSLANSTKIPTVAPGALGNVMKSDGSKWISEALTFTAGQSLLQLSDTPADYTGKAGSLVKVNGTEDGIEFVADGGVSEFLEVTATEIPPTAPTILNAKIYTLQETTGESIYINANTKLWLNAEDDNPGDRTGRHGSNNALQRTAGLAKFGTKAYYDNKYNYIIGNLADFDFTLNQNWSIDFWYTREPDGNVNGSLIYLATSSSARWFLQSTNTGTHLIMRNLAGAQVVDKYINTPATGWKHVAVQRKGSSIRIFLNGVMSGHVVTDLGNTTCSPTSLYIVCEPNQRTDEVRLMLTADYPDDGSGFTPLTAGYADQIPIYSEDAYFMNGLGDTVKFTKPEWDSIQNKPTISGINTGDQVGDGVTITGAGTIADPFVSSGGSGGVTIGSGAVVSDVYEIGVEHLTSKYYEGKPVYRKVIDFGALPVASSKTVLYNIDNMESLVNLYGEYVANNGGIEYTFGLPRSHPTATVNIDMYAVMSNQRISITTGDDHGDTQAYVTLEYTKTTDSVVTGITSYQDLLAGIKLTADTTVNFVSTETAAQIQAKIDAQPKNLGGFTLTFQFADGTYTLNTDLLFTDFYGGGRLNIYGNLANGTARYNTQSVILNITGTIRIYRNFPRVFVYNIKVNTSSNAILLVDSSAEIKFCSFIMTIGTGVVTIFTSIVKVADCYFSGGGNGISAYETSAIIYSINNASTGTSPTVGLRSAEGSTIAKSGTQPTGSTNEIVSTGGVIR